MTNAIKKIKSIFTLLLALLPSRLPIGMEEFDKWATDVLALTKLPDNDSTRFALASTIPHQKAESFYVSKFKFACLLQKSAANQIGGAVMHEMKEKQLKRVAEEAAKQAEATAQEGQAIDQETGGVQKVTG